MTGGLLDDVLLPGGLGERRRRGSRWWRRIGTLLLWGTAQGIFLFIPPLAGVAVNLALAATFVWWFALRRDADARRRRVTFRLRPIGAAAPWLPVVAAPLLAFALSSMIVVPRVIPLRPTSAPALEAYLRRPFGWLAVLALASVVAPLLEEFLFRGWVQRSLERRLPAARAILVTALLFSVLHLDLFGLPVRFAFGMVVGYAAWSTRSIWPGVVLHGAYNGGLLLAAGLAPGLDERALARWAYTPRVFWPALAALVVSGLALVWAARRMGEASRHAHAARMARRRARVTADRAPGSP